MDIGKPGDYLRRLRLHLESLRSKSSPLLAKGDHVVGDVLIDPTATVAPDAKIGPNVSIGANVKVMSGARLSNCVVMSASEIRQHARVQDAIVGWEGKVGQWAVVTGGAVLRADIVVGDEVILNGPLVLPHKEVKESVMEVGKIIM